VLNSTIDGEHVLNTYDGEHVLNTEYL
jgi:hypothetical protein